jgi:hypothetical protein
MIDVNGEIESLLSVVFRRDIINRVYPRAKFYCLLIAPSVKYLIVSVASRAARAPLANR